MHGRQEFDKSWYLISLFAFLVIVKVFNFKNYSGLHGQNERFNLSIPLQLGCCASARPMQHHATETDSFFKPSRPLTASVPPPFMSAPNPNRRGGGGGRGGRGGGGGGNSSPPSR